MHETAVQKTLSYTKRSPEDETLKKSQSIIRIRTDNEMVKRKGIKTITLARKTLHRKLLIEQHEHKN
jgi:translation initiation factor 1 (eIF-1/SUI1)